MGITYVGILERFWLLGLSWGPLGARMPPGPSQEAPRERFESILDPDMVDFHLQLAGIFDQSFVLI